MQEALEPDVKHAVFLVMWYWAPWWKRKEPILRDITIAFKSLEGGFDLSSEVLRALFHCLKGRYLQLLFVFDIRNAWWEMSKKNKRHAGLKWHKWEKYRAKTYPRQNDWLISQLNKVVSRMCINGDSCYEHYSDSTECFSLPGSRTFLINGFAVFGA